MSLGASILDTLKTIPAQTIATFVGAGITFLGVVVGQYLAHRYTQRREDEKILREKAEELINMLCQIQHSLFVWHEGLLRKAMLPLPPEAIVGHISLGSLAQNFVSSMDSRRSPALVEYQSLVNALPLNIQRADVLQRLYFPRVQRSYEAHSDAVILLVEWLESQMVLENAGSSHWPAQFCAENEETWPSLNDTYQTVYAETIEAVARVVRPYRAPSRALSRLRRLR